MPIISEGDIPDHRNRSVEQDEHTFLAIVKLFLRSWPFIRPQVMGRWLIPGEGVEESVAEEIGGGDYNFYYAPVLLLVLALTGPYLGLMPTGDALGWEHYGLYGLVCAIVLCFSYLAFTPGKLQLYTAGVLVFMVFLANFVTTVVIDGSWDGIYMALVTIGCLIGWTVQLRSGSASPDLAKYRVRVGAHLVYYYGIEFVRSFVAVIIGLLLADMINMSILQNNPLTPTIANTIGIPEAAFGETLSKEIRYDIQFKYVVITLGLYFIQLPFNLVSPWYRIWILQRINQDLRLGLQERWLKLSLQYHSEHRVGDSIFRIYQDSSQVTGVIERLMEVARTLFSYFVAVVFLSLLDPWLGLIASSIVIPVCCGPPGRCHECAQRRWFTGKQHQT